MIASLLLNLLIHSITPSSQLVQALAAAFLKCTGHSFHTILNLRTFYFTDLTDLRVEVTENNESVLDERGLSKVYHLPNTQLEDEKDCP